MYIYIVNRYSGPGFCGVCDTRVYTALDAHMIACHLELGQLWRCPVEWCAVWKGSGRACLEHIAEKHGGWTLEATTNVAKFFPPWTVTCDVWHAALRPGVSGVAVDALLFHEAGRRLVHRYRVYKDPFPHPALRDGVIPRLLSCVPGHGHRPAHSLCLSLFVAKCRSGMRSPCWARRSRRSVYRCFHH